MNFGRSINARKAMAEGRSPASRAAASVGLGCTASWVSANVPSCEWHHTQANLGGNGRPTEFFHELDVLASWLLSNFAARHANAAARRRVRPLLALARDRGLVSLTDGSVCPLPVKTAIEAVDLGLCVLVKREYVRSGRRYLASERQIFCTSLTQKGDWYTATDFRGAVWRAKASTVVRVIGGAEGAAMVESEQAKHRDFLARVEAERAEQARDVAARKANREAENAKTLANLIARCATEPTPGRLAEIRRLGGEAALANLNKETAACK